MSKRRNKGDRNQQRRLATRDLLEIVASLQKAQLCRGCRFKNFCPESQSCRAESLYEAKLGYIAEGEGEDALKEMSPLDMGQKLNSITDEEIIEHMRRKANENIEGSENEVEEKDETGEGDNKNTEERQENKGDVGENRQDKNDTGRVSRSGESESEPGNE